MGSVVSSALFLPQPIVVSSVPAATWPSKAAAEAPQQRGQRPGHLLPQQGLAWRGLSHYACCPLHLRVVPTPCPSDVSKAQTGNSPNGSLMGTYLEDTALLR